MKQKDNSDGENIQQTEESLLNKVKIEGFDDLLIKFSACSDAFKNIPISISDNIIRIVNNNSIIKISMNKDQTQFDVVTCQDQAIYKNHIALRLIQFIDRLSNLCRSSTLEELSDLAMVTEQIKNFLRTFQFNIE